MINCANTVWNLRFTGPGAVVAALNCLSGAEVEAVNERRNGYDE
jgi:hypothetical protein